MPIAVTKSNNVIEIPQAIQIAQGFHGVVNSAVEMATTVMTGVDLLTGKVSGNVKQVFGAMSFVGGGNAVFAVPNLVKNAANAIRASNVVERVKNIFHAVTDISNLWTGISSILNGLRSVGAIAVNTLRWVPIVNIILFPLQFAAIGIDAHQLSETRDVRNELLAKIGPAGLAKHTIVNLTAACKYVAANSEKLYKTLQLSKETKIAERAQTLFNRLNYSDRPKEAKKQAEEFMKILKLRIHTKYNLEVAGLVAKIAGVVLAGVALFVPPNPVTWGLAGIFGLAPLAIAGLGMVLLHDDPFSAPKDVWYSTLAHKVREGFGCITNGIDRLSVKATLAINNIRQRCLQPA